MGYAEQEAEPYRTAARIKELESQLTSVRQELAAANEKLREYSLDISELMTSLTQTSQMLAISNCEISKLTRANKIMREALWEIVSTQSLDYQQKKNLIETAKRTIAAVDALENGN